MKLNETDSTSQQPRRSHTWAWLLLLLLLASCASQPAPEPEATPKPAQGVVPEPDGLPGWTASGEVEYYDHENLYSLVNGQADAYLAYGLEEVAVHRYADADEAELRVRIWKLPTPADAFGLYSTSASGVQVPVGNGGHTDEGRYLAFWQDRYYVELFALPPLSGPEVLQGLAHAVSATLPTGGEPPSLLDHLPTDGLEPDSTVFFHKEISIQDYLWLGGENLLGLSPETEGILTRYDVGGNAAQLLIVRYPAEEGVSAGLEALEDSDLGVVAAKGQGTLLGAVFGEIDAAAAEGLLASAMAKP